MTGELIVTITVITASPEHAARSAEAFARAATGLALEGISVNLHMGTLDDDDVEEPA